MTRPTSLAELLRQPCPWVVAHRGDSAHFPENSLSAFRSAISKGADLIELDLCLSRDRVPVVIHDRTLERTTNGNGAVAEMDFSQLRKLDCGSWLDLRFREERLPSLKEVLQLVSGQICLNIEIKGSAYEARPGEDGIESQVCQLVYGLGCADQVVVSSFEHRVLDRIRGVPESLPVAPLLEGPASAEEIIRLVRKHHAFSCHVNERHLGPELAEELGKEGIVLLAYTVNNEQRIRELADWGISGIITNDPGSMRKLMTRK